MELNWQKEAKTSTSTPAATEAPQAAKEPESASKPEILVGASEQTRPDCNPPVQIANCDQLARRDQSDQLANDDAMREPRQQQRQQASGSPSQSGADGLQHQFDVNKQHLNELREAIENQGQEGKLKLALAGREQGELACQFNNANEEIAPNINRDAMQPDASGQAGERPSPTVSRVNSKAHLNGGPELQATPNVARPQTTTTTIQVNSKPSNETTSRPITSSHNHHPQIQASNPNPNPNANPNYATKSNTTSANQNGKLQHSSPNYASLANGQRMQDTRTHVVGELYDTERSYVESLEILVEKYMKPLKSLDCNKALIDSNLVDEIFHNLPEILEHHESFLTALQERLSSDWESSQRIAHVLIETFTSQEIIETYTAFINNWKNARQAIKIATQARPAFERFLESMAREHKNKLTLDALLIMPVQRIPRYELLIKELIKHTPENHPDYSCLLEAQEKIHKLALKIDHAEKEMMHQEQLKDLESLIEGHLELQHPERDFLRYDLVTILSTSSLTIAKKERVLFLFCDLLIMTSLKKKSSKRTNLQLAFSNSYNDLSLLEGNKFKLLFKLSIDQVDVRIEDEELAAMQAPEDVEQQRQLKQQIEALRERRQCLQSDMSLLRKIENVCSNLTQQEFHQQMVGSVKEMCACISDRLQSLDQNEEQIEQEIQEHKRKSLMNIMPQQHQFINPAGNQDNKQANNQLGLPAQNNNQQLSTSPSQNGNNNSSSSLLMSMQSSNNNVDIRPGDGGSNSAQAHDQSTELELVIYNYNTTYNTNLSSASNFQAQQQKQHAHEPAQPQAQVSLGGGSAGGSEQIQVTASNNFGSSINNNSNNNNSIINSNNNCLESSSSSAVNLSSSQTTYDTLVIGFTSYDRRQAFLHAFVEAKNQRYRQHRQQSLLQQQRVFNSAANLKPYGHLLQLHHDDSAAATRRPFLFRPADELAAASTKEDSKLPLVGSIPNSLNPLQLASTVSNLMNRISPTSLTSSISNNNDDAKTSGAATPGGGGGNQHASAPLRHQMSAPNSLYTMDTCLNNVLNSTNSSTSVHHETLQAPGLSHHHQQHSHSQLIHQPASHPAPTTISSQPFPCCQASLAGGPNQTLSLDESTKLRIQTRRLERVKEIMSSENDTVIDEIIREIGEGQESCNLQIGQNKSLYKWAPKFVNAIPLNFLNTQHLSMQFTCSILKHNFNHVQSQSQSKSQVVRDKTGQFWVCLSNGFVSHVALIMMVKQGDCAIEQPANTPNCADDNGKLDKVAKTSGARCEVIPLVQSAGDVCKSQITCICQVNCPRRRVRGISSASYNSAASLENVTTSKQTTMTKNPEIEIESISPPVDIKNFNANPNRSSPLSASTATTNNMGLSESAPTVGSASNSPFLLTEAEIVAKSNRSKTDPDCRPMIMGKSGQVRSATVARVHSLEPQSMRHLHQGHHLALDCKHHHVHSHLHHSHQHHYHNQHHVASSSSPNNVYATRHNTVPMAQLRRSLERQTRISKFGSNDNSENESMSKEGPIQGKLTKPNGETSELGASKASSKKAFKPAKMLLHQTSFKTNSILARLVGGSKKSARRKLAKEQKLSSENENSDKNNNNNNPDSAGLLGNDPLGDPAADCAHCIVSPLSSNGSSLNSSATNSSITINSACASSPYQSRCDLLIHSYSASCCAAPTSFLSSALSCSSASASHHRHPQSAGQQSALDTSGKCDGMRSRSATVPSRPPSTQPIVTVDCNQSAAYDELELDKLNLPFNISDISREASSTSVDKLPTISQRDELLAHRLLDGQEGVTQPAEPADHHTPSALWLGCDDGSLIVIDCLANDKICSPNQANQCNVCDMNQNGLQCSNYHSEIKLDSSICDIVLHEDTNVFVALANGQLVVFSRESEPELEQFPNNAADNNPNSGWSLTNPKIISMAPSELNTTSKICQVNQNYLWFSYGRNIIVFDINNLTLTQTVMAPSNNLSLQIQIPISISQMSLTGNGQGIWVVFNHSQIVQLYSVRNCLLMAELNIRDSITRMLLFGNEIIRHHKISTLKATSILVATNQGENHAPVDRVFIGTSAGLILSMNLSHELLQFDGQKPGDNHVQQLDLKTRIVSLRHGHCGSVKFIHQIPLVLPQNGNSREHEETLLVSGGPGIDLYGPDIVQRLQRMNVDEDDTSHLIIWKM